MNWKEKALVLLDKSLWKRCFYLHTRLKVEMTLQELHYIPKKQYLQCQEKKELRPVTSIVVLLMQTMRV